MEESNVKQFYKDIFNLIVEYTPTNHYELFGKKFTDIANILFEPQKSESYRLLKSDKSTI